MSALPDMSNVVASNSPATVTTPSARVIRSVSSVCPIVAPLILTLSITACVIALLVPKVAPSTLPPLMSAVSATKASILAVPSI